MIININLYLNTFIKNKKFINYYIVSNYKYFYVI